MCDYSLENVKSRAAVAGDKLVSTRFVNAMTKGFAGVGKPDVAVCLLPGTELAFKDNVEYEKSCLQTDKTSTSVATFRQIDLDNRHAHHDALEFAGGLIIRLAALVPGQFAEVLKLPVDKEKLQAAHAGANAEGWADHVAERELVDAGR